VNAPLPKTWVKTMANLVSQEEFSNEVPSWSIDGGIRSRRSEHSDADLGCKMRLRSAVARSSIE
jgi:hypothetical protein